MANSFQTEWEEPELESLATLAENLAYRLRGCDDTLVRKTLQEVAREFVADTQCLTTRQRLAVGEGGMCYPIPLFGGNVAEVREVWKFDRRLRRGIDWNWPIGSGLRIAPHLIPTLGAAPNVPVPPPSGARRYTPRTNVVGEAPSHIPPPPSPFTAVVVEHLPLFYERLPKVFLEVHGDAICSGVLSRLFAMANQPWSDPQQAAQELIRYDNAKSELRMKREIPVDGRAIDTSEVL